MTDEIETVFTISEVALLVALTTTPQSLFRDLVAHGKIAILDDLGMVVAWMVSPSLYSSLKKLSLTDTTYTRETDAQVAQALGHDKKWIYGRVQNTLTNVYQANCPTYLTAPTPDTAAECVRWLVEKGIVERHLGVWEGRETAYLWAADSTYRKDGVWDLPPALLVLAVAEREAQAAADASKESEE